jgi:hypothetical protein
LNKFSKELIKSLGEAADHAEGRVSSAGSHVGDMPDARSVPPKLQTSTANLTRLPETPVDIEDINSWPRDGLELMRKNRGLILAYHQECKNVDDICEKNVEARIRPPVNKYAAAYQQLVQRLESILGFASIVVFHCSRLTDYEARLIKADGL